MKHRPARLRALAGPFAVLTLLSASALVGAGAASAAVASRPALLALGDSVAAGYQPIDGRRLPPVNPATGYRDQGYPNSYPADVASDRGLALTDLACPGETTSSMLTTPAHNACAALYRDEFGASSQLAAATDFLDQHKGHVALVTLDVGANDLDHCASTTSVNYTCLVQAAARLEKGFSAIVSGLQATLHHDDPAARLVTMNYYDPFLALAERPGGAEGMKDASASLAAVDAFNAQLTVSARLHHVQVADVARVFQLNALFPITSYAGRALPKDVVVTCKLTWMCPANTAHSIGPDIHPNLSGYQAIATAFEHLLPTAVSSS